MSNHEEDTSVFIGHEPCPSCGSKDNLSRYSDGHAYCFGCKHYEPADGKAQTANTPKPRVGFEPVHSDIVSLPNRGISEETCSLWGYGVGLYNNKDCHVANYRDPKTGTLVGQKLRFAGKDFLAVKASGTKLPLYGAHLWRNERRSLIVTEGELDALSASQAQQNKYPVVSLPQGAQSALGCFKENYEWLCEFEKIVIMFDNDEHGRAAADACADIMPAGKVFIAEIDGYKDANEALVDGKPSAITSAFWNAKPYQPDGIFTLSDIRDDVMKPVEMGKPWFLPTMTTITYGRRDGEVYYFGAGCVDGRTEFLSPTGWKRIDEWAGEKVSQYNQDGSLTFVEPEEYVKYPCPEMHEVKLKYGLSMALSPEHRVVHFSENTGKLSITPFSEVMVAAQVNSGGFRGLIKTNFTIQGDDGWDDNLLRLQVAVEADGSMCKNKAHIRVKNQRKKERILGLLELCGISFKQWDCQGYSTFSFTPPMRKGTLYSLPYDTFGTRSLAAIADEAPRWDGDNKRTFRTTVKESADFIQFAMSASGLRAAIMEKVRADKGHTEYRVLGTKRSYVSMRRASFVPMQEKFKYCFQVSSGMLVLRRDGRIFVTGNTGVGKTDFFTQQIAFDILTLNIKTACIYLEQPPSETGKRIAGKTVGKHFHIPADAKDNPWEQSDLDEAYGKLEATNNLYLGGNFAAASWDQIKARIRYLAHSLGVKHIFLDHLTALADPSNERESLEIITKELALLAQELKIIIHVISHLSTPDGKPHEEGGRVMLRHFKGSRAIGFWAHFAFGLERNPQDEDPTLAQQSILRCLKDRYTGRATGKLIPLGYNTATGLISECGGFTPVDTSKLDV